MQDTAEPLAPYTHQTGSPLTDRVTLRFAVGAFDTWPQVQDALRDLRVRGLVLQSLNCVALEQALVGKTIVAPDQATVGIDTLPFPDNPAVLVCTSGPLAECLLQQLASGARSLKKALEHWLIPRHAAYLEDAVLGGKLLLWIQVRDADDERRAYQALLMHSSNSVGVHDLILPKKY